MLSTKARNDDNFDRIERDQEALEEESKLRMLTLELKGA